MNVLILYTNFGAGHKFVARQLKEVIENDFEHLNIYLENTKKTSSPKITSLIENVYMDFFTKYAHNTLVNNLYGLMFYITNNVKFLNYNFVQKTGQKDALKIINDKNIDLVICTYPYYLKTAVPCVTILTDYDYFKCWNVKKEDYYVVNNEENVEKFMKTGIKKENIYYSSIPISGKFNSNNNNITVKNILFNLGARGQIKVKNLKLNLQELLKYNVSISIMCGKNQKLYDYLIEEYKNEISDKKIIVYPFISNVYEILSANDLVITKAGGISLTECIQNEKPLIINISQTLRGQERSNYDYILENKIGEGAKEKDIYKIVIEYLNNSKKYETKVKNIKKLKEEINSQKQISDIIKEINKK